MADLTDTEIDAAIERGLRARASEPRAESVRFDRDGRSIVMRLTNGCTVTIPVALIEGLRIASDAAIAEVAAGPTGSGLHWPTLDIDLSVPHLLAGTFGTARHMASLGGRSTDAVVSDSLGATWGMSVQLSWITAGRFLVCSPHRQRPCLGPNGDWR